MSSITFLQYNTIQFSNSNRRKIKLEAVQKCLSVCRECLGFDWIAEFSLKGSFAHIFLRRLRTKSGGGHIFFYLIKGRDKNCQATDVRVTWILQRGRKIVNDKRSSARTTYGKQSNTRFILMPYYCTVLYTVYHVRYTGSTVYSILRYAVIDVGGLFIFIPCGAPVVVWWQAIYHYGGASKRRKPTKNSQFGEKYRSSSQFAENIF